MPNTFSIDELQTKRKALYDKSLQLEEEIQAAAALVTTKGTELSGVNNSIADLDAAITILEQAAQ